MSDGLRHLAQRDLGRILEDETRGFGWPIVVTNPEGLSVKLSGRSNDIAEMINVETGAAITGRFASVSIRISLLTENGLDIPRGIVNVVDKPWLIKFDDINGNSYVFKVTKSKPDRTIGIVNCVLELYQ